MKAVFETHFKRLAILVAIGLSAALIRPIAAQARFASIDSAPLHIARHDRLLTVSQDATWFLKGTLTYKVNNDLGRTEMESFEFPATDRREELRVLAIEVSEPGIKPRFIAAADVLMKEVDKKRAGEYALFLPEKRVAVAIGNVAVGSTVKFTYELSQKTTRIPGLFYYDFVWGLKHPELSGTLTIESKSRLFLDISTAAKKNLSLSQGRLPNGLNVWKAEVRKPVFLKTENEAGGLFSTSLVPRIQISNQNSWNSVASTLSKRFPTLKIDDLPPAFRTIAEAAKLVPKFEDRLNKILELVSLAAAASGDWIDQDEGFTPLPLVQIANFKRGSSKDIAFATVSILRALGYTADVTLVWKEPATEKIWLDDPPKTVSLNMFNHAIVRVADRGQFRYFDPNHSVPFGEGYLSDVSGSWALTLSTAGRNFERLPTELPSISHVKIVQNFDLRPDLSIAASGTVKIEGPIAAELKILYFSQNATQAATSVEPYLKSLLGLFLRGDIASPTLLTKSEDRRGNTFEFAYSYLAQNAQRPNGAHRDFDFVPAGLAGVPLLAAQERETDVLLSKNLTVEVETRVIGGDVADETNTSCIALTPFASIVRETKAQPGMFSISEHMQFKSDRLRMSDMKSAPFKAGLKGYSDCLTKSRVSIGPRPAFELSPVGLSADEVEALKKPVSQINLQDIKALEEIATPQLQTLINTKIWLATREMLRRNIKSPTVILQYASSLLETGHVNLDGKEVYLTDHLTEAAKLFGAAEVQRLKSAKLNRVHGNLLFATERYKDALVAYQNALAVEPGQSIDALMMGRATMAMGDTAKAETWLQKATTSNGSRSVKLQAIEAFADLRIKQNRIPDFINLYKQAINESPRNAWTYHEFARKLQGLKLWDLSIEQSRRALQVMRFLDAEKLLAETLMKKAAAIYFIAPGIITADVRAVEAAERLALETLKYTRDEELPFRIAGHAAFLKAMKGDYGSLIATQSYFAKAIERGASDEWIKERHSVASQALESRRPLAMLWASYLEEKKRNPASRVNSKPESSTPKTK